MSAGRENYFWTPRGDAEVVASEGGRVTLAVVLASYGPGADSWAIDTFNALEFVCLQCIVGYWESAKYAVAVRSMQSTPELVAAVEGHPHAAELDRLSDVSSPLRATSDDDWFEFAAAAQRIVVEAALSDGRTRLSFRVADPSWVVHMAPLRHWCLG